MQDARTALQNAHAASRRSGCCNTSPPLCRPAREARRPNRKISPWPDAWRSTGTPDRPTADAVDELKPGQKGHRHLAVANAHVLRTGTGHWADPMAPFLHTGGGASGGEDVEWSMTKLTARANVNPNSWQEAASSLLVGGGRLIDSAGLDESAENCFAMFGI